MSQKVSDEKSKKDIHNNKQDGELLRDVTQPSINDIKISNIPKSSEEETILVKIYLLIRKQCNMDFTYYKRNTILRCIDKRMKVNRIQELTTYFLYLQQHSEEVDLLCQGFLIAVTRFFRDNKAFDIISQKVIPSICENKNSDSPVRAWVVGCSTGEEAYSLAILFKEYMDAENKFLDAKIFATDVDNIAIEYARIGIYPESIAKDISPNYLNKYFIKRNGTYQVARQIREMVVFSYHNAIINPPFSKIDFLSCRNMLIYFQPILQNRVLSLFHYALNPKGFLFLGTSETVNKSNNVFTVYDSKWKIFERNETSRQPFIDNISVNSNDITKAIRIPENIFFKRREKINGNIEDIHKKLIEDYLPSSVIINETNEIVQVCGDVNKYLKISCGKACLDILKMVPKNLSTAIGTAVTQVKKDKTPVKYKDLTAKSKDEVQHINLIVKPFPTDSNDSLIMVIFEEIKEENFSVEYSEEFPNLNMQNKYSERIVNLEQELSYTREGLQNTLDEIAVSSEELQSSNEELLVSNEEMHSTNEELQSVNEELIIVNNQYQYTIQELTDLNNDMSNFINSTDIGTLFLDNNLCVRKFTPAITKEINLIEQDIGRPISHISHSFINQDIINDAIKVLNGIESIGKEVQSKNGSWYILKYSPYRILESEIKGVVISLIDITERKKGEEALRKSKERYEQLVESSPYAIIIIKNGIILFSNTASLSLFGIKDINELLGSPIKDYFSKFEDKLIERIAKASLEHPVPIEDTIIQTVDTRTVDIEITSMPITLEGEDAILLIVRDISSKKQAEQLQIDVEENIKLLNEKIEYDILKTEFFSNISHELKTPLNVIACSIQLLENYLKDKTVIDDVNKISKQSIIMKQNCYRLLRLINNIIDITKADSGFLNLSLQNCNIVNIVEEIVLSVTEFIENKSIKLLFDTQTEEKVLACDPDIIERIMLNLLSNAIKFTNIGGSITVNIYDKGETILISVKDTGIGIPEDKLDIIFERFGQVDSSLTKKHEGSGIGLSLVKALVEKHNGKITVESSCGIGSEFTIELPVKIIDEINNKENKPNDIKHDNIEKIKIEFSDIYQA